MNLTISGIEHLKFFFSFLNTYSFPIFKIWKRKTIWAVLIFDGFLIFRSSLFFTGEYLFPELAEFSNLVAMLGLSKFQILLFLRVSFPELADLSNFVASLDLSKLKILLQISLTRAGFFARRFGRPAIQLLLFHHLTESCHPIDHDFFSFNRLKCNE